ncbi:MAG TPA: glycoside hydrolase domain-containing protein, partial [Acidobacteriaceae bacterium]|nr:glycoside hydrolase domain-containing protein [Acidobacteriaceae bacterium]
MYPAIPGLGGVVLGSPRYTRTVVHLGNGHKLTITRHGNGNYVQSVMLNGKPHPGSWVAASALLGTDGTLDFTMSETPGSSWATAVADRPPSSSETH